MILAAAHLLVPSMRPAIRKFYTVSYVNPTTGLFGKGLDDLYLVFFWIVAFTFLRSLSLDYIFVPLARRGGITTRKGVMRFSEQAWLVLYYGAFWLVGTYLLYHSSYWFNLENLWTDWPLREVSGLFKWYYLAQFAFWLQQIFILHIEDRRKDHVQMFAHHIITCALIAASYTHHLTRVGHVILIIMDFIDILLSAAKLLKYLGYSTICDVAFGVFLITWAIGRHGLYVQIIYSVWKDSLRIIQPGCYTSQSEHPVTAEDVDIWTLLQTFSYDSDFVCYTRTVQKTFMVFLVALQIIMLMWFYMILRVAWRVVHGGEAEDTRSDDEAEHDEFCADSPKRLPLELSGDKPSRFKSPNGSIRASGPLNSVMLNGHSRSHLSPQPWGED